MEKMEIEQFIQEVYRIAENKQLIERIPKGMIGNVRFNIFDGKIQNHEKYVKGYCDAKQNN